jgi:hypothetical protein
MDEEGGITGITGITKREANIKKSGILYKGFKNRFVFIHA